MAPVSLSACRAVTGVFALIAVAACSPDAPNVLAPTAANLAAVGNQDDLGPALAAQRRHSGRLMADRDLLGTAVGRLVDGRPNVTVYARNASAAARAPRDLDGIPVVVDVTGDITVLPLVADKANPFARPGGGGSSPTGFFANTIPIGVSTGNAKECASGTIGAKLVNGGSVYALSNNHVFARMNAAGNAEAIYQPGRYDLSCGSDDTKYTYAHLASYQPINFNGGDNKIDAAIASVDGSRTLSGSTPTGLGYGSPSSETVTASVGMAVQKFGRTTGYTSGTVVGINVTVNVSYPNGVARFVGQIAIRGDKGSFSRSGDSGSLIVTNTPENNPVGLLFAGGQTTTFANRISDVLAKFPGSISR
jgi:hypothetical protein